MSTEDHGRKRPFGAYVGVALEMVTVAAVSALVATVLSPERDQWVIVVLLAAVFVAAFSFSPLILDWRADVREYERAAERQGGDADRVPTVKELQDLTNRNNAELVNELRKLQLEVAELRKPWWRRRRAR